MFHYGNPSIYTYRLAPFAGKIIIIVVVIIIKVIRPKKNN